VSLGISQEKAAAMRQEATDSPAAAEGDAEQVYGPLREPLDLMAEELTKCLRYYRSAFPNRNIERAVFVGGQANDKRLCQMLAERLNLPAQIGDPLVHVGPSGGNSLGSQPNMPLPALAVAVGLSIGAQRVA
jgi:Tfp pilus assembly PilM family ATPase